MYLFTSQALGFEFSLQFVTPFLTSTVIQVVQRQASPDTGLRCAFLQLSLKLLKCLLVFALSQLSSSWIWVTWIFERFLQQPFQVYLMMESPVPSLVKNKKCIFVLNLHMFSLVCEFLSKGVKQQLLTLQLMSSQYYKQREALNMSVCMLPFSIWMFLNIVEITEIHSYRQEPQLQILFH